MHKIVVRAGVIAGVALMLGYTGCWYYGAKKVEKSVLSSIADLNSEMTGAGFHLEQKGLTVGGFPFLYRISINEPVITKHVEGEETSSLKMKKFVISSNLLMDYYTASITGDMVAVYGKESSIVQFVSPPFLTVAMKEIFPFRKTSAASDKQKNAFNKVKTITYQDMGAKIIDAESKEKLSSSEPAEVTYNDTSEGDKREVAIDIDLKGMEGKLFKEEGVELPGKVSSAISVVFSTKIPPANSTDSTKHNSTQCSIKKLHFSVGDIKLAAVGNVTLMSYSLPLGELNITLGGVESLTEYLVTNHAISNEESGNIKTLLGNLSSPSADKSAMEFNVKSEVTTGITIGKHSLMEVMEMLSKMNMPLPIH